MISQVENIDCMERLPSFPDKFFDLAIIDPPYGIDASNMKLGEGGGLYRAPKKYKRGNWDKQPPGPEFFRELLRVSRDVIIFGANHFISRLPAEVQDSKCWIVWDKNNGETSFADVELAWSTFDVPARLVRYTWSGFIQGRMGDEKEPKIHPTQKPVYLYEWILAKFATAKNETPTHMKILDTHMGSQASRIASHKWKRDYWGFEIDPDYFASGNEKFLNDTAELTLF